MFNSRFENNYVSGVMWGYIRSRTHKTQLDGDEFYGFLPKILYEKKLIFSKDGFLRANNICGCFWIARAVIFCVIREKRLPGSSGGREKGRRTVIRAKLWRSHYEFRFSKHVHRSPRVKARRVARYVRRNRYKILPAEKFHSDGLVCYRRIVFFFLSGPIVTRYYDTVNIVLFAFSLVSFFVSRRRRSSARVVNTPRLVCGVCVVCTPRTKGRKTPLTAVGRRIRQLSPPPPENRGYESYERNSKWATRLRLTCQRLWTRIRGWR